MSEQLRQTETHVDQFMVDEARAGDILRITTGQDEDAWRYEFLVTEASKWPTGVLTATAPDGTISEPISFELHGAGMWTDRKQNPVQTQARAFSSYYQHIYLKGFLVGRVAGEFDRIVFDKPGQEITQITICHPE